MNTSLTQQLRHNEHIILIIDPPSLSLSPPLRISWNLIILTDSSLEHLRSLFRSSMESRSNFSLGCFIAVTSLIPMLPRTTPVILSTQNKRVFFPRVSIRIFRLPLWCTTPTPILEPYPIPFGASSADSTDSHLSPTCASLSLSGHPLASVVPSVHRNSFNFGGAL